MTYLLPNLPINIYFLGFTILATFDFLRNLMYYFDLYIELYTFKNYKTYYYKSIQLENSNKISLKYIFSNTLAEIYKISLNDELCQKPLCSEYFRTEEVLRYKQLYCISLFY